MRWIICLLLLTSVSYAQDVDLEELIKVLEQQRNAAQNEAAIARVHLVKVMAELKKLKAEIEKKPKE